MQESDQFGDEVLTPRQLKAQIERKRKDTSNLYWKTVVQDRMSVGPAAAKAANSPVAPSKADAPATKPEPATTKKVRDPDEWS